jgi:diaminopimelate decarboxylase
MIPEAYCYRDGSLFCEEVALADIAARTGTPCYVYSSRMVLDRFCAYDQSLAGLPHLVCYAIKANSSLALLALLARAGAGFDVVSAGEIYRVIRAGGDPSRVVYSGVGKTAAEIEYALEQGIHSFNCESEAEIQLLDALAARRGVVARIAVRVNPNVNAGTHPYISTGLREHKFGIDLSEVEDVYLRARSCRNVSPEGVSCHIGSQILDPERITAALDRMIELTERLRSLGLPIQSLDLGGGLGVPYKPQDRAPQIRDVVSKIRSKIEGRNLTLLLEPGRSIVGEAGVLLTRVLYRKRTLSREFIVVDAAMTDLIRPSLYQSHHEILPVRQTPRGTVLADVVGPVCESGDFLALDREMPNVLPGDFLSVSTAGAYGFVLSSNYNSRMRPPEVLVDGGAWRVIRTRETFDNLIQGESV